MKGTKKELKITKKNLAIKDQELSDLKIDFLEVNQLCQSYQEELEKRGDIEQIKKRLENEKRARKQLVKEKVEARI